MEVNNELCCIINMFSSSAEIIYPDENRESVPADGVLEYLYETCKTENYDLHLMGNKKYIEGLIEKCSPLEYGCGKVNIKVN